MARKLLDVEMQGVRLSAVRYVWDEAISAQESALQLREMPIPTMRVWHTATNIHEVSQYQ